MAIKRFAIEMGYGADLHGENMTKAALRAVRDSVSRVCLCGLLEILGRDRFQGVHVHARVAVPEPDAVDRSALLEAIPIGEKTLTLEQGGMLADGLEVPDFGLGRSRIVMACAALTVSVDMDETEEAAPLAAAAGTMSCGCSAGDE